ncbi:MAG: HEAT repeat domain-containing protein [Phycisphaerae bacterium]|nr:HEAT repeat domain-containing protein [Phycisphaerae bacterium]
MQRIDTGVSIPALTKLMCSTDKNLRDYARRALEMNPASEATQVILDELKSAKDSDWKIGLINSLAQQRVVSSIDLIAKYLDDSDSKVAGAAVVAITKISSPQSGKLLVNVLKKPFSSIHIKTAEGLLDIAQIYIDDNDYATASAIYQMIYNWTTKGPGSNPENNVPFSIRGHAMVGLILCNPETAADGILEIITDKDPKIRVIAVHAARNFKNKELTRILCEMLSELQPDNQKQVLALIADRGDNSFVKYIIKLLDNPNESVRLEAIVTLAQFGSPETVDKLVRTAATDRGICGKTAYKKLETVTGPNVQEANATSLPIMRPVSLI